MISFLSQPWPWFVSGPLIALVMFLMLWMGERFGVSSTLRSYCAIAGAGKHAAFFDFDWKKQRWNIVFVIGAIIGGAIAGTFLDNPEPLNLSQATIQDLEGLGITFDGSLAPESLFSWSVIQFKRDCGSCCWWIFYRLWSQMGWRLYFWTCHKWLIKLTVTFSNSSNWVFYRRVTHDIFNNAFNF